MFKRGDLVEVDGKRGTVLWAVRSAMKKSVTAVNVEEMTIFYVEDDGKVLNEEYYMVKVGEAVPERKQRVVKQVVMDLDPEDFVV